MLRLPPPVQVPPQAIEHYKEIALRRGYYTAIQQFETDLLKATWQDSITAQAKLVRLTRTCLSMKLRRMGLTNNPPFKRLNPSLSLASIISASIENN